MHAVLPVLGRLEKRTDQEHRGARRSHDVRERRAHDKEREVSDRAAREASLDMNAARDHEEHADKKNERDKVAHDRFIQKHRAFMHAEHRSERHHGESRPGERHLAVVVMPEIRKQQRKNRDREQNAREGHCPDQRKLRAMAFRGVSRCRREGRGQGDENSRPVLVSHSIAPQRF